MRVSGLGREVRLTRRMVSWIFLQGGFWSSFGHICWGLSWVGIEYVQVDCVSATIMYFKLLIQGFFSSVAQLSGFHVSVKRY